MFSKQAGDRRSSTGYLIVCRRLLKTPRASGALRPSIVTAAYFSRVGHLLQNILKPLVKGLLAFSWLGARDPINKRLVHILKEKGQGKYFSTKIKLFKTNVQINVSLWVVCWVFLYLYILGFLSTFKERLSLHERLDKLHESLKAVDQVEQGR